MNYIATKTRPNISFSVLIVARFSKNPGTQHWSEVKRCCRYLKATRAAKLTLQIKSKKGLEVYSDATWADNPATRTSQLGYVVYLFGSLIAWHSYRQKCVTYSATKAELNPLVDSFHEETCLKAVVTKIWKAERHADSIHFIKDSKLLNTLLNAPTDHYIENRGLDEKLEKFGSNPKN